jgi:RES domain-containing protein
MVVFRLTRGTYTDDLTGHGAALYGNRWNRPGTHLLYTASTRALAVLEVWASSGGDILKQPFEMISLDFPDHDDLYTIVENLPKGWDKLPSADHTQKIGSEFVESNKYLGLWVPSVIVQDEYNFIINPNHPAFPPNPILDKRPFRIDPRLLQNQV